MKVLDIFRMSITNLFKRFLRTFMTVSGVIIGTCAIIVMVSIGTGLNKSFQDSLEKMADLTMININGIYNPEIPQEKEQKIDAQALAYLSSIPNVRSVTPQTSVDSNQLSIYTEDHQYIYNGSVTGVNLSELKDFGLELKSGAFPDKNQILDNIMFGENSVYSLRKLETYDYIPMWDDTYENILPPPFEMSSLVFKISPAYIPPDKRNPDDDTGNNYGYYNTMSYGMFDGGQDEEIDENLLEYFDNQELIDEHEKSITVSGIVTNDDRYWELTAGLLMDITLLNNLLKDYHKMNEMKSDYTPLEFQQISLRVDSMDNVEAVEKILTDNYYQFWSYTQYRTDMQKQNQMIQMVLGGLAAISLFVAAIGIFNTMVMAITERTKEIGVMKVLGCSLNNIRAMFLIESGAIGLLGGIAGTLLSFLISFLLNTVARELLSSIIGQMSMEDGSPISIIEPNLILFALVFSILIGLISGFIPANRATKISALEAINQ